MGLNNGKGVCDWYKPSPTDITALKAKLYPGDRLEFTNSPDGLWYCHWGIYVGPYQGEKHAVIHFGIFEGGKRFARKKLSGRANAAPQKPEIRADTIEKILGGSCKVRINNFRDTLKQHQDTDCIIQQAKDMHQYEGQTTVYDLVDSNCEHFVNLCRYGEHHTVILKGFSIGSQTSGSSSAGGRDVNPN
ncbi:phospholipase A and acyltransferase 1-like [Patiria miniata]|uniref:LRAT domain-containing protein n=1 Tax=Patiria miniata TaxID=46514 RepID=A0A914A8B8_PATMI|nr:phospholipase A and acyltransferase 1-like [Patiria miniata]